YTVEILPLALAKATRDGYDMDWYADAAYVTKVGSLTQCADTALWAKWTPLVYDIIYHQNGGSGATNGHYNIDSLTITLPTAAKMHKAGYTFGGWYDNVALTGDAVTTIPAGSTGNKDYWAKWEAKTYNITYNLNATLA
ncbi:InlB B-repeat-containing protein, partial [Candidatus Symbiothrix dinenymphae]|uniref:InlB B-repeat-containing protein n=1 Tax=Candidatus Symbiothrix dinenymphae TaxID=467085 RepID=UPI000A6C4961